MPSVPSVPCCRGVLAVASDVGVGDVVAVLCVLSVPVFQACQVPKFPS